MISIWRSVNCQRSPTAISLRYSCSRGAISSFMKRLTSASNGATFALIPRSMLFSLGMGERVWVALPRTTLRPPAPRRSAP